MKLYRVILRGMTTSLGSHVTWGISYVIAPNPTDAYEMVRQYLVDNKIGFDHDRELSSIELLADDEEYPDCNIRLYLPEKLKNEEINTTQIKPGDWVVLPDKHSAKVTEVFKDDGGTTAKVTTCFFIDDLEVN